MSEKTWEEIASSRENVNQYLREHGYDPEILALRGKVLVETITSNIEKDEQIKKLEHDHKVMRELMSEKSIEGFAMANGAMEVHRSWRDNMLSQKREVSENRMKWETLSDEDKLLDARISRDVILDFVTWLQSRTALLSLPVKDGE